MAPGASVTDMTIDSDSVLTVLYQERK